MRSNIRELRRQKHISQKDLGDIIGLSQQVVSRMELDRSKIQVDILLILAEYFGVSTDCVLGHTPPAGEQDPQALAAIRESAAGNVDIEAVIEKFEQMDSARKRQLWRLLAVLKQYL